MRDFFGFDPAAAFERFQNAVGQREFLLDVSRGKRACGEGLQELVHGVAFLRRDGELARGVAAGAGERIDFAGADFGSQRQHGAQDFAERSAVVAGDPVAEAEEFVVEDRFGIDQAEGVFEIRVGRIVMNTEDDAGEFARAEGDEDACAGLDAMLESERERVGESLIERDWQADVAELRQKISVSGGSGPSFVSGPLVFEKKGFQQARWPSERRTFKQPDRLPEIEQAALRRKIKHTQRAGDTQALPFRSADASALIDEQQIGLERCRQGDCGGFSLVKSRVRDGFEGFGSDDLKPGGQGGDPALDQRRRDRIGEFSPDHAWKRYPFKQAGKNFDMADQDQIIDRAGVGDHQPHVSEPQFF